MIESSRCKKCNKVRNVCDLEKSDTGIGFICINVKECKIQELKDNNTDSGKDI